MDEVVIRPCEAGDESRVRELAGRLTEGFAPWRDPDRVRAAVDGWVDSALGSRANDDHAVFVAALGDGVIGFIGVEARDHYISGRDGYIGELVVGPEAEGRGVGGALVDAAEGWAAGQGCERLTLQTGAANERARGFYESRGFDYEDVSLARPIGVTSSGAPLPGTGQ